MNAFAYKKYYGDEVRRLATLSATTRDLESAESHLNLAIKCDSHDELDAHVVTALIRLRRAIAGRNAKFDDYGMIKDLFDNDIIDKFKNLCDKHIAHSIGKDEQSWVKFYYEENDMDQVITQVNTGGERLISPSLEEIQILMIDIERVIKESNKLINTERMRLETIFVGKSMANITDSDIGESPKGRKNGF